MDLGLGVSSSSLHIHVVILLSCICLAASAIRGNETDQIALLEFKAKVTDPLGVMSSWNKSVHFCQWYGVTCSHRHQRVTLLNLMSYKLGGSISPHLGNLSFLRELRLGNNSFGHELPHEIGRLSRLQYMDLGNNSLVGKIPANLSSCLNLIVVNFGYNHLVGDIPMELGSLRNLQYLYLHANNLTGEIPSSFANFSSLSELALTRNNLAGSIPDALGQLKNITFLGLAENRLSGTIPPSIFNLSSITTFDVGMNQLHGVLPLDLCITLPYLQIFRVSYNQFAGSIPVSISNASNLVHLMTVSNNLTGKVPTLEKLHNLHWLSISLNYLGTGERDDLNFISSLTNATNLEVLATNGNSFGGILPISICNLSTTLWIMLLDNNQMVGSIPTGIGSLINLGRLELWNNHLSGSIPDDFGNLQALQVLYLTNNILTGSIPSSLGNLTKLNELHLSTNDLQGSIPSSLGKCQRLLLLDLAYNNINGTIPAQVFRISSLSIFLDLSGNQLTGSLPLEVGYLNSLSILDVSENMLSGEIPSSLGSCSSLEILNLEGNIFNGFIPPSFHSLRGILNLDLSRNNLSGEIPKFLADFNSLQNLNLSLNNFVGMVPIEGVFKNASAVSVYGNSKLCGGILEFHLPKCTFKEPRKSKFTPKNIVLLVFALVGGTLSVCFLFLCWFRKKSQETASSHSSENSLLQLSYQSLLTATDGFSSANLIGSGSFGSVYKGVLYHDTTVVAVKVFNLQQRGASKSFLAECDALRNIRHRNLVKIITACSSVDFKGNDFKALVYEFMVNGSLEECLHPKPNLEEQYASPRKLNLLQRINIAIDVASALDYLHHNCQTMIVHCDLKPSNVLLDNEMTGHVGDFGLVKFLPEAVDNRSANETSSIGLRGSVGYAAPEYGMGSEVSSYGDVYSYGILLLEMFTGRRPTDEMFKENLNFHKHVKMALTDGVAEIADPVLLEGVEEGETTSIKSSCSDVKIEESLASIFKIGIACSAELPRDRMDMTDVVSKLNVIRHSLLVCG